jgi:hypothetical protein
VGGGKSCGGYFLLRVGTTRWPGLWSTQAKVEGIMPKSAWHWGSDSSDVNDPLGEQGHIPLYVSLPSSWGCLDSDYVFPPFHGRVPFGDCDRHM